MLKKCNSVNHSKVSETFSFKSPCFNFNGVNKVEMYVLPLEISDRKYKKKKNIYLLKGLHHINTNVYIRKLSSVQNKVRLILHEPYNLSLPLSGRSLGKNIYYCASSIYFFERKTNPPRFVFVVSVI